MKNIMIVGIFLISFFSVANAQTLDACADVVGAKYRFFGLILDARIKDENKIAYCQGVKALVDNVEKLEREAESLRNTILQTQKNQESEKEERKVAFNELIASNKEVHQSIRTEVIKRSVPPGTVAFFTEDCPTPGWRRFVAAEGRYIVGVSENESINGRVGERLTDLENRPSGHHIHQVVPDGVHNHSTSLKHNLWVFMNFQDQDHWLAGRNSYSKHQTLKINNSKSHNHVIKSDLKQGTNAPYIALRPCEKT